VKSYQNIRIDGHDTDKPLNVARRLRLARKYLPEGKCRFLDCGCGSGGYVSAFNSIENVEAFGIEFDKSKVDVARTKGLRVDQVLQGDIQNMNFADSFFDVVLLNEVLEHIPDQYAGLKEVNRVLKPGGTLLVFSPNRLYPFETHGVLNKRSGARVRFYIPFIPWIPVALGSRFFHYQARNYWPGELLNLLEQHDLKLVARSYVWQTFENISGEQPAWIKVFSKYFRSTSLFFEKVPLLRRMGASQFLAMKKPKSELGQNA